MNIEPAHIDQIRRARNGRMVLISADAGGVAEDLRRIDPGLKVRFAENGNPPFWAVYWESEDKRTTQLVLTVAAHQNSSGVWEGLDQRVVKRIQEIDPHGRSGYDYAKELERLARERERARVYDFEQKVGPLAEQAAAAVRKDLGSRYKGRAFITNKPA